MAFESNDLRRTGTQAKRAHDLKAKWAYGCRRFPEGLPRPAVPATHYLNKTRLMKRNNESNLNHASRDNKLSLRFDVREVLNDTDSSRSASSDEEAIEEVHEPAAPEVITQTPEDIHDYNVSGHAILLDAVNQAVEKFETKETEKIVREYEMVSAEDESGGGCIADDGFELVDRDRT